MHSNEYLKNFFMIAVSMAVMVLLIISNNMVTYSGISLVEQKYENDTMLKNCNDTICGKCYIDNSTDNSTSLINNSTGNTTKIIYEKMFTYLDTDSAKYFICFPYTNYPSTLYSSFGMLTIFKTNIIAIIIILLLLMIFTIIIMKFIYDNFKLIVNNGNNIPVINWFELFGKFILSMVGDTFAIFFVGIKFSNLYNDIYKSNYNFFTGGVLFPIMIISCCGSGTILYSDILFGKYLEKNNWITAYIILCFDILKCYVYACIGLFMYYFKFNYPIYDFLFVFFIDLVVMNTLICIKHGYNTIDYLIYHHRMSILSNLNNNDLNIAINSENLADNNQIIDIDNNNDKDICIICTNNKITHIFECGHKTMCELCQKLITKCPICRQTGKKIKLIDS